MPEVRLVDVVENEVGEGDRVDQVVLLAAVEGTPPERLELLGCGRASQLPAHELVALGKEPAGAAARVVNGLADLGRNDLDHGADDFARREELAAVVALLAHLQQQALVNLGEGEDVGRVHVVGADVVHLVEDVEQVALGVDARPLDTGHDLADDLLSRSRAGAALEAAEVRQQLLVHEPAEAAERTRGQLPPLRPILRCPVAPAIGWFERRREFGADGLGCLGLAGLPLVEDSEEQDPCQLGHVLERTGAVRSAHDVPDTP